LKSVDVSVAVPALNEQERIEKCLKSIKAQEFKGSFEIIVADGNSEDRTREIARKYADKVVVEKRRGIAFERNAGAKFARGKIIAFIDSDGIASKDWLQTIWASFEKNPKLALLYGSVFFSDGKGFDAKLPEVIMPLYLWFFRLLGFEAPVGSNLAIKRSIFEKINGFDPDFITCEDLDLAKRAKKLGSVEFNPKMIVKVSARRIKKWGYIYYALFHISNIVQFHVFGKAYKKYEDVR